MNQNELVGQNFILVEGLISHQSYIIGKTLNDYDFKQKFSSFVLAIKRQKDLLREKIAHIKLKFSDTILIMVPKTKLKTLKQSKDLIILEELDIHLKYQRYWWLSILVIPMIMILFFWVCINCKAVILGSILILVLKVISIQDAYESIDWSVIFLIAALIPLGRLCTLHKPISQLVILFCILQILFYHILVKILIILSLFQFYIFYQ